jgi:hypothetical protein
VEIIKIRAEVNKIGHEHMIFLEETHKLKLVDLSTKKENTVLQMEMLTKNVGKITNA